MVITKELKGVSTEEAPSLQFLPMINILASELNPRKEFEDNSIQELADSIRKIGLIQAIVVRPAKKDGFFEIVCGERRYRASKLAGLFNIPASVRDLSDQEAMELMITENLQRKDVHPLEESDAFQYMLDRMSYTMTDIAAKVAKSEAFVLRRLQLNRLNDNLKNAFRKGELPIGHAELLSRVPEQDQEHWYQNTFKSSWNPGPGTIKNLRDYLEQNVEHKLADAPFELTDGNLIKTASGCNTCPKNSAVLTSLFPDKAEAATCHDRRCFDAKVNAHFEIELVKAIDDPAVVLIDESYGSDKKTIDRLKKQGLTILKRWDDYEPNNNTFADSKKGKPLKAFHVSGNKRGSYTEVFLKLNKGVGAKLNENQAVQMQRDELNQKLRRGLELDQEKVFREVGEHIKTDSFIIEPLPINEDITTAMTNAMIIMAYNQSGEYKDQIFKELGFEGSYYSGSVKGEEIIETILNAPDHIKSWIVRLYLLNQSQSNPSPSSVTGAILFYLADYWCPHILEGAKAVQDEIRIKREAKINKQLQDLEQQITDAEKEATHE